MLPLAGSLALLVSAALPEMADRGSYIPWSKEQFFFPSNSSSAAEVEKMALNGSNSYVIINLADDVSRFSSVGTQRRNVIAMQALFTQVNA